MKALLLFITALTVSGCANIRTNIDYNTSINFSQFNSWAWLQPAQMAAAEAYRHDGLYDARIRAAIENELPARGLFKTTENNAGLLVNYLTSVQNKVDINTFYNNFGYYPYYRPDPWRPVFAPDIQVQQYQEGTLIIDLIDAQTSQLVWRGTATSIIDPDQTPAERTKSINKAVKAILAQYPPTTH
ncbi:MAG: DUF4136 domain-containing protein [Ferrimonas sp.]